MNERISAEELFEQQRERLGLRWLAGERGRERVLESVETVARRPSLAGYLNIIYPNKVQILGSEELAWLDALDPRLRWDTIVKIIDFRPLALVISKNQSCPEAPLLRCPVPVSTIQSIIGRVQSPAIESSAPILISARRSSAARRVRCWRSNTERNGRSSVCATSSRAKRGILPAGPGTV